MITPGDLLVMVALPIMALAVMVFLVGKTIERALHRIASALEATKEKE